ncbi:hypothetical protein ACB098_06G196700 [Castanea mollissima]
MDHLAFWLILPIVWACIHVLTAALGGRKSGSSTLPPGPRPFPIIGNILELGNKPHQDVAKLSKTYGPLMTLKLGSITTIVISSPDIAKEALQKYDQAFSSRTIPDSIQVFNHPQNSMSWLPALARWRNLRKLSATKIFAPQQLDATQTLRQKKVKELLDHVDQCCSGGEVVDIGRVAFITVLNTISNTFFSIDLAQYSSNLQSQEFQDLIFGIMELLGKSNIVDYFPALRLVDPQGIRKRMKSYFKKLIGIFDGIIKERVQLRASSEGSKTSNDVLDSFLNLAEEDDSELSCDDFKRLLLDLFIAGIDTTSSTVEWALSELIHNPEKMAKARDELKEVLGKDRLVQEVDISKLPFLQAIVKETLRLHPPAPFLVPHKAETNVEMRGFIVPKNAQILVNVWAMGRDSSIWTNPNLFMPERFLEQDINFKGKYFELIPFGAGRRICPGLPFANRMVPLMLASLVHFINWKLADEINPEDLDMSENEIFGLTLHRAKPLRVIPTTLMDYLAFCMILIPFVWACIAVLTSALGGQKFGSSTLPPGPHPFPIIGNILERGNKPHQAVAKLSKTYGPLMTLKLGSITTIHSKKKDQALSSRTIPDTGRVFNHHEVSIVWLPALAHWRNLRKVCATQIFAPQQLDATQALRQKKVQELLDHVNQSCSNGGKVVDIGRAAFTTVLNELVCVIMEMAGKPNIADYFPVLSLVDPQGARRRMTIYYGKLIEIFDRIIDERVQLRASKGSKKARNDLLDSFLNFAEDDNSELSRGDFKHLLLDLFVAGVDTTSSTIEWAMAELLHNPEKMAKAQDELEKVLGKDGLVQELDISKFPFLQAIVKETFRLHPPAPFLVPHKAETAVEMCGFTVPKNAQILVNVWAMGRDPSIWTDPNIFFPERFFEHTTDFKGQDFELIPFGAGRRICPGLPLANKMVHFMLASLVHCFHWRLADEMKPEDIDMSETFGITLHRSEPLRAIPIKL